MWAWLGYIFLFCVIVILGFLNIPRLRRLLSAKVLRYVQKTLPPMSETERIALEAGDVWWEGELFCGKPNWKKWLAQSKPQLSTEEQIFLDHQVETLCGLLNDWEIIHQYRDLSSKAWQYLKQEKFFGLVIPKKYGGLGFSALAHSAVVIKIATRSISAAVDTMVPNSLGPAELILQYGTEQQKEYYLPRLARGEDIPCFGLTGIEAGSDATAITDTGVICRDEYNGENVIGIRLNWYKRYITLAPIATLLGVAFKCYDPDHLLGEKTDLGITLALIPHTHPGVQTGLRHAPGHMAFMNGPMRGENVFIPLDWIVGGVERCGQGWQMLMECLSVGRGISLPAIGTAIGQLSYRTTGAYARIRQQFKLPIGKFAGVQEALAHIAGFTYLCEATRIATADAVDQGIKPSLVSAITKYHLTELGRRIINDAMDVHAGKGIQLGEKNYIGLVYDAIPMSITVEGANILTRSLIIFGQGAMRCHPYVQHEMQAAQESNPESALQQFDKLLMAHLRYTIGHVLRNIIYGLSGGIFIKVDPHPFSTFYQQLTRMSTALALTADIAMAVLGGELKRRENLSARLGDVLSYLYLSSCVLRYYENQGRPQTDLAFVTWCIKWCLAQTQQAFDGFFANFKPVWVSKILQRMIFPWGKAYQMPLDGVSQQLAEAMLHPSPFRDRLTHYCYRGKEGDAIAILEKALQTILAVEPLQLKLQQAVRSGRLPRGAAIHVQLEIALKAGILNAEEIQAMQTAQALYEEAIAVDAFKEMA